MAFFATDYACNIFIMQDDNQDDRHRAIAQCMLDDVKERFRSIPALYFTLNYNGEQYAIGVVSHYREDIEEHWQDMVDFADALNPQVS